MFIVQSYLSNIRIQLHRHGGPNVGHRKKANSGILSRGGNLPQPRGLLSLLERNGVPVSKNACTGDFSRNPSFTQISIRPARDVGNSGWPVDLLTYFIRSMCRYGSIRATRSLTFALRSAATWFFNFFTRTPTFGGRSVIP